LAAVQYVENGPLQSQLGSIDQMRFYSLYKQATAGDVQDTQDASIADKLWEGWKALKGTTTEDAKKQYVELLAQYAPSWEYDPVVKKNTISDIAAGAEEQREDDRRFVSDDDENRRREKVIPNESIGQYKPMGQQQHKQSTKSQPFGQSQSIGQQQPKQFVENLLSMGQQPQHVHDQSRVQSQPFGQSQSIGQQPQYVQDQSRLPEQLKDQLLHAQHKQTECLQCQQQQSENQLKAQHEIEQQRLRAQQLQAQRFQEEQLRSQQIQAQQMPPNNRKHNN